MVVSEHLTKIHPWKYSQERYKYILKMSKRRGRPKGSFKRSRSTLPETSLASHDEELVFIQSGLNYESEIAEAFATS